MKRISFPILALSLAFASPLSAASCAVGDDAGAVAENLDNPVVPCLSDSPTAVDVVVPADSLAVADASAPLAEISMASSDASAPLSDASATAANCRLSYFRPQQLVFPAAAIALGGAGVKTHLFDTSCERERWTTIDDKFQYVPIAVYTGLGFIPGVRHEHHIGERFLAGATAYVCMTAICQGIKHAVGEPRPDSGKANSFPSGHTATAFCGAELCRIEYGNAYGAAAYAFAVTTGVLRVVNNRHWCNDVLAGAGIGFLSAHVGYWLMPYERRLCQRIFRCGDRSSASTPFILAPTYEYAVKAPSLTFAMTF